MRLGGGRHLQASAGADLSVFRQVQSDAIAYEFNHRPGQGPDGGLGERCPLGQAGIRTTAPALVEIAGSVFRSCIRLRG